MAASVDGAGASPEIRASKREVTRTCCLDPRETSGATFEDRCNGGYCKDVLGKARCYGGAAEATQTCWENEKDKIDLGCCGDDGKPAGFGKPGTYCTTK
ncbi:MAG: hypothetical protein U0169_08210 [Polyangiaceae bacterium]